MADKKYRIDPDLASLVRPMSEEAIAILRENLSTSRKIHPIRVWDRYLLLDYTKVQIMQELNIPIRTKAMDFHSRNDAILWICRNQLNRGDLSKNMRRYLMGRMVIAVVENFEETAPVGDKVCRNTNGGVNLALVVRQLQPEFHCASSTVRVWKRYAELVDEINRHMPAFKDWILSNKRNLGSDTLSRIASLPGDNLKEVCQMWMDNPDLQWSQLILQHNILQTGQIGQSVQSIPRNDATGREPVDHKVADAVPLAEPEPAVPERRLDTGLHSVGIARSVNPLPATSAGSPTSVKDMPAYDPDAELSSLAFTIPSWGSSIHRVRNTANFEAASHSVKRRLRKNLTALCAASIEMLALVEEEF